MTRSGIGYDVHRLVDGRRLILGGVDIPYEKGLLGHSDADVLLHAVSDALLGAAALGDIGKHFPDTDVRFAGADSGKLLEETARLVRAEGYAIGNVDATVVAQAPKLQQYIPMMRDNLARFLGLDAGDVNVKATTEEKLGYGGSSMENQLKKLLGIEVPIIQGGMAWISEANLASAVSNAGGAGIISTGGRTTEYTRDEIRRCRTLTDRPFGVNVMLMAPNRDEIVDVICEEKPAFVTLGAGNPVPYFEKLHAAGVKVIPVVPSVKLAKRVEEKGADAIVVEGMEAGGHIGVLSTMPLMEQVIPEVSLPVIMAGGFGDGRGLAAALLMGAAGVQMGTRFLVAEECVVHPNVKAKLIEAVDTDTIVTGITIGGAVRGVKNKFSEEFVALEYSGKATKEELLDRATGTNKLAAVDGDVVNGMVQAGETLTLLRSIEPTRVIIEHIVREARETLAHAKSIEI